MLKSLARNPRRLGNAAALILGAATAPGAREARAEGTSSLRDLVPEIQRHASANLADLVKLYHYFHTHPELSSQEEHTAARLAAQMKALGFEVTPHVRGHGLVCVLHNGKGPTVLVRTDMDALPVVEQTGLPYASHVRARDKNGNEVGVMHACGHGMQAIVTRVEHYGVWLESEGRRGLLLIPDMSHRRVSHPSEYARSGDVLTVKVIRFNWQNGDFVASRKELHPEEATCETPPD